MDANNVVRGLRYEQKKRENDFVGTCSTDISAMCRDSADCIESLQAQLAESQRREKAAVDDFTSTAHNGNILCEFCGADCIDAGNDTGGDTGQCGCFEWRGPEEGGKNE